jgi:ABC-type transporter Mla subunit MlaD
MIYLTICGAILFLIAQIVFLNIARLNIPLIEKKWLKWSQEAHNSRRSREELLRQLDFWLLNDRFRLRLKRLSTVAPLFGVSLTAMGFMMLGEGEQQLKALSFTPLYSGVFAGVLLAMINQAAMTYLEEVCAQKRSNCEEYFAKSEEPVNAALDNFAKVIDGISRKAKSTVQSALSGVASDLTQSTQAIQLAGTTIQTMAEKYSSQSDHIDAATTAMCSSMTTVADKLSEKSDGLIQVIDGMGTKLTNAKDSLANGSTSIETAAATYAESANQFNPMLADLKTHIDGLKTATGTFQESSAAALNEARQLGATLKPAFEETSVKINSVADECVKSSQKLTAAGASLSSVAAGFEAESQNMNKSTTSLTSQFPVMDKRLQSLTAAIGRQEETLTTTPQEIAALLKAIDERLQHVVSERSVALAGMLQNNIDPTISNVGVQLTEAASQCESTTEVLVAAAQQLQIQIDTAKEQSEVANENSQTMMGDMDGVSSRLGDNLEGLSEKLDVLSLSIDEQKREFASQPSALREASDSLTEATGSLNSVLVSLDSTLEELKKNTNRPKRRRRISEAEQDVDNQGEQSETAESPGKLRAFFSGVKSKFRRNKKKSDSGRA